MKDQIREVQKYFEEKLSNGDYSVVRISNERSVEVLVDGKYSFCLGFVGKNTFQHSMDNFIMLKCEYIYSAFLLRDIKQRNKETKLKALELLTKEIESL